MIGPAIGSRTYPLVIGSSSVIFLYIACTLIVSRALSCASLISSLRTVAVAELLSLALEVGVADAFVAAGFSSSLSLSLLEEDEEEEQESAFLATLAGGALELALALASE